MVVILKIACFSIWMVIMLFTINGSRKKSIPAVRQVLLQLDDEEDIEMSIRLALKKLCTRDRLIIKDYTATPRNKLILERMVQRNPSILFITAGQYCI